MGQKPTSSVLINDHIDSLITIEDKYWRKGGK